MNGKFPFQLWKTPERKLLNMHPNNPQHLEIDDLQQVPEAQDWDNQDGKYDENNTLTSSRPAKTSFVNLVNIWWLEAAACLLILAMLGALVGTIYPYQDKPLPQWPYMLSINTIVAFYSEVMKAAMVLILGECLSQLKWSWFRKPRPLDHMERYDNASRGPWGAFELLWTLRLSAILPSIGAVITILALLLVPFAQQTVHFYSCTVPDTTRNASIPKTNFASAGTSLHIGAGLNSIEPHVQAVMNGGIYDSDPKRIQFNCLSGNCTFDGVYHSMGWCSRCEDVSDEIEIHYASNGMGPANFTLPSSNLSAMPGVRTFVMGPHESSIQAILGWDQSGTVYKLSDTPWGNRGYGAAECSIDPCIRSYTGTVKSGVLTETVVSTFQDWNEEDYWFNAVDMSCVNTAEKQALRDAGYSFDEQTAWLPYNLTTLARDAFNPTVLNATNTTIRPECIYQTYRGQVYSLTDYLGNLFTGQLSYAPNALGGPTILQTIFEEGNVTFSTIDDTFARLAHALTVWSREQGGGNVTGLLYRADTCVSAQWGWLAYPLALVLGTIVFLAWTIDRTRRDEGSGQDYKSSPLALLFHRLGDVGSEGPALGVASRGEFLDRAKKMTIVFQGTDDKVWRFVDAD
ncbi:hypothetical protein AAE478_003562 [Parahypoxylon ruwenzoriense]